MLENVELNSNTYRRKVDALLTAGAATARVVTLQSHSACLVHDATLILLSLTCFSIDSPTRLKA